jgi:hypothetical protein
MSNVIFQAPGPFHLPALQRAKASVVANTAQMTLYASIPGYDEAQPISCEMSRNMAHELGVQLLAAASELEMNDE